MDRVRFTTLADLPGVRLVQGWQVKNRFPRHVHAAFCVGLVDRGSRLIGQGKKSTLIPENGLFVINPGEPHTCASGGQAGHSYRILCLDPELLHTMASQMAEKFPSALYFPNPAICDGRLKLKIQQLLALLEAPQGKLEQEEELLTFLSELIIRQAGPAPRPPKLRPQPPAVARACEYIRANYAATLTLKELAQAAGLSPFHFHRVFLKTMGISPHDYLVRLRVEKALELLKKGGEMAEVALETGFVDQSHFSRFFKRIIGTPPGRYFRLHALPR
jgi:AraC-like DNA-binding protein